jgi:hypothetical protein
VSHRLRSSYRKRYAHQVTLDVAVQGLETYKDGAILWHYPIHLNVRISKRKEAQYTSKGANNAADCSPQPT